MFSLLVFYVQAKATDRVDVGTYSDSHSSSVPAAVVTEFSTIRGSGWPCSTR